MSAAMSLAASFASAPRPPLDTLWKSSACFAFVSEPGTNAGKCKGVKCWPAYPNMPYKALKGILL